MIQIQNGRFHHNWEKHGGDEQYRRYKNIRPAFVERWEQFKRFVGGTGGAPSSAAAIPGAPVPRLCSLLHAGWLARRYPAIQVNVEH
jgi:hypothetical protein